MDAVWMGRSGARILAGDAEHLVPQGSRSSNALLLPTSSGTETWSCAISQLPSTLRKQIVPRTQYTILSPFLNVALT